MELSPEPVAYMHAKLVRRVQLFVTLWTVASQAPLSMGFSRQEYWSGLPFPSPIAQGVFRKRLFDNLEEDLTFVQ